MTAWPCIYCRRLDVPRTREHVLQASLGAVATLPTEVCGECNAAFSPIDSSFIDAVGFFHTGERVRRTLGTGRATLPDGVTVNARLRRDGLGEFPPQLYQVSPSEWRFLGHRTQDFDRMVAELDEPATLTVKTEVVSASQGLHALTIVRSAPRVFVVQGGNAVEVESFASFIRKEGLRKISENELRPAALEGDALPPPITYDISLALDLFSRALAKVALNYVCYRLGPEVALRVELDPIRRFARFGEGSFVDFMVPTLLNHSLADSLDAYASKDHHALYLLQARAADGLREAVFVAVKGKTVGRVDLTRGGYALPEGTWMLSRFDPSARSVADFTLPGDMPRAVINPGAFGMAEIWPQEWIG